EGLNGATVTVGQQVNTVLSSKNNEFVTDIEFLVVPKITDLTPSQQIDITNLQLPKGITLADPQFFEPSKIDILLVTDSVQSGSNKISCHLSVVDTRLDDTLRSFWEIEALPEKTLVDDELKYCMEHFNATHTRDSNGRYIVQMPIIKDKIQLGSSKDLAVKRLNSTLIRLNRSPDVKKLYNGFLDEYKNLGHMEEVKEDILPNPHYYFPHQAILRPDKSTTKLLVFNASSKTSNGISLNDTLLKGGTVQNDLWCTLLRFLTYGTTCAPFLSTRTLLQLSEDEKQNFPLASPIVKNDFYVDDVLSCAPDLETAIEIQQQLIGMMNAGGMHLYKWCSNSRHLLSKVSTDDQEYVVGNDDLIRNNIWLSGPDLLHSDVDFTNNWDCSNTDPLYMKELKPIMNTFIQSTVPAEVLQEKNVADIF
ncbi:integrase catalytic domain-containing protein, partial [Trichonephila clavata]